MICNRVNAYGLRTAVGYWWTALTIIGLCLGLSAAKADSYRHHEAHEHGAASLNIAIEGHDLYIEFSSPAINIVGFEHHPRTQQEKAAISEALKKLEQGQRLFRLPPDAASRLVKADVDTDIGHDTEGDEKNDHVGEKDHQTGTKASHEDGHHEDDKDENHSEFKARYHFVSNSPKKLSPIDVQLFSSFPGIEHIEVQLLVGPRQTAMELTAKKHEILF